MACALCQNPRVNPEPDARRIVARFACDLCGQFEVTLALLDELANRRADYAGLLPYLTAHTKQSSAAGQPVRLATDNIEIFARQHQKTTVAEKLDRLLRHIQGLSAYPGYPVILDPDVHPLFDVEASGHMAYLLKALVDREDIEFEGVDLHQRQRWVLTPAAWDRLTATAPGAELGTVFVAMAFSDDLRAAFDDGIRPAVVDDCMLTITHVGTIQHNDSITDLIMAGLRRAQIVIADVTHQRNGVYFEAGFAMGLGRTVIWMCRQDQVGQIHFDTSHLNHIVWNDAGDLRGKLTARLRGTVAVPARLA